MLLVSLATETLVLTGHPHTSVPQFPAPDTYPLHVNEAQRFRGSLHLKPFLFSVNPNKPLQWYDQVIGVVGVLLQKYLCSTK